MLGEKPVAADRRNAVTADLFQLPFDYAPAFRGNPFFAKAQGTMGHEVAETEE